MSSSSSNEPPHKRVALTTIAGSSATSGGSMAAATSRTTTGSGGVSSNSANNNTASNNNGATGGVTARKTYRFDLKLFEPTADSFPEFNYAKLVEMEEKKQKKLAKVNGASLDDHNDDDVARIARELERKYGNAYAGKNCGKNSAGGACYDKGTGYDESDSFIDNTDAYDESVPVEIETDRGGFYINSGSLVFKPLANFERPDDALRIPKARKRTLSTSSESDGDDGAAGDRGTDAAGTSKNGPSDKKAKLLVGEKDRAGAKSAKLLPPALPNIGSGKEATAGSGEKLVKTTTVKDMLRAKRDSMRNLIDGGVVASSGDDEAAESAGASEESSDDDEDDDDEDDDDEEDDESDDDEGDNNGAGGCDDEAADVDDVNGAVGTGEHAAGDANGLQRPSGKDADGSVRTNGADVRLPADLPADLLVNILRLCDSAAKATAAAALAAGGPAKFSNLFDAANTDLLYRIDTAARAVGGTARNTIYNYLEHYLPCTKQTLQMRAKKCRLQREEAKTHKIVRQLRVAVEATMPQVMAAYEVECKRISDLRAEAVRADNREQLAALKAPKRRFVWTEATRALNAELFAQRRQSYFVIKPRKETLDEFVHKYVREHVVRVWPDGFMRLEELVREFEKRQSTTASGKKPKEKKIDGAAVKAVTESAVDGSGSSAAVSKVAKPDVLKHPSVIKVSIEPTSLTGNTASMPPAASPMPIAAPSTPFGDSSVKRLSQPHSQHPASITNIATTTATTATTASTTPTTTATTTTTKRSTDHSINSIISSSPVPQTHSATPSPPPSQPSPALPATTISVIGAPTPPPSTPTVVASVAAAVVDLLTTDPATNTAPTADTGLRIRHVESLHADTVVVTPTSTISTIPAITVQMTDNPPPLPLPSAIEELLSSDSDDVEFVGECDLIETLPKRARTVVGAARPAPKSIQINRQKYAKRPADEVSPRSNSPMVSAAAEEAGDQGRRELIVDAKADDLDVDKIMSALKELQKPPPLPLPAHRPSSGATTSSVSQHPNHHHHQHQHQQQQHSHNLHQQQQQQQQQRRTSSDQQQAQQLLDSF